MAQKWFRRRERELCGFIFSLNGRRCGKNVPKKNNCRVANKAGATQNDNSCASENQINRILKVTAIKTICHHVV